METLIYVSLVLNILVLIPIVALMAMKSPIVAENPGSSVSTLYSKYAKSTRAY